MGALKSDLEVKDTRGEVKDNGICHSSEKWRHFVNLKILLCFRVRVLRVSENTFSVKSVFEQV